MNILLVDDEVAMIRILMQGIDWGGLAFNNVYYAYNANEAKKVIMKESVQIVICDIEMPQENGISLLRWVKSEYPQIVTIILTGYPDFHYAQDAISVGVFKYLLKPIVYDELKEIVLHAVKKLEEDEKKEAQRKYGKYFDDNKKKAEKFFYRDLITEEIPAGDEYLEKELKKRGMEEKTAAPAAIALFRAKDLPKLTGEGKLICFALINIAEELFEEVVAISLDWDIIWIMKEGSSPGNTYEMCLDYISSVKEYMGYEFFAYFSNDVTLGKVLGQYRMLLQAAGQYWNKGKDIYCLDEDVHRISDSAPAKLGAQERASIELVKNYLETHYDENINRKDVENLVHLNADYLNRIFKCATGCTLMEYMQYYRVIKAKSLLADSMYSIGDVGGFVGYDSSAYFSKIFKKWTGITPIEYRNRGEKI